MTTISFIGDIMLGRFVTERYAKQPYKLVSESIVKVLSEADVCIANLESPITSQKTEDSLKFAASAELLEQFKWIDYFSLSNNHINDFGNQGMSETIKTLETERIGHNGIYTETYKPILIENNNEKIAIVTCADMMNYEFSEDSPYKTLRVNQGNIIERVILQYKSQGYFVVLYAHVGMLFSRFPNPVIRDFIHRMVDVGADCVITVHPHCLGGYEIYKEKLIVYSLGDFLMDGASFRRRKAGVLNLTINNGTIASWFITPVLTNDDLQVCQPNDETARKMLSSFDWVSKQISEHSSKYTRFYKYQYKKEL